MRKTFPAILALVVASAGLAFAQDAGAVNSARIAVIDMARVSAESKLGTGKIACFVGITFYLVILLIERLSIPWHASVRNSNQ